MGRIKKTVEEKRLRREQDFLLRFEKNFGAEFEILSPYNKNSEKIEIKHLECGESFWITYKLFQHSPRCRVCQIQPPARYKEDELKEIVENIPDYELLSSPSKIGDYVELRHLICGTVYKTKLSEFRNGHRCPVCASNYKPLNVFYDELEYQGLQNEYTLLNPQDYNGYSKPCLFRHEPCGYEYTISPRRIITARTRCAKCQGQIPVTEEEANKRITEKFHGELEITQFNGWGEWGWVHCNRCGYDAYKLIKSLMRQNIGCINCQRILARSNLSLWDNGLENITALLRESLFEWKEKSKKYWNDKCCISGMGEDLVVHHLIKPFAEIRTEVIKELDLEKYYSASDIPNDIFMQMLNLNKKKHEEYGVGVVLTSKLHNEFHKKYGVRNNTPEQFIEFAKEKGVSFYLDGNVLIKDKDKDT